jgi:phage terminase small subunit
MTEKRLTSQQELFCQSFASGLTQIDAYKKAYPKSEKWKPEALRVAGAKMMARGNVSVRIQVFQAASADLAELDGAEIMREIKRVALSDIGSIMHADGKVKLPNELDAATRAAVASFEIDEYGRVKYKFWDKNTALANAGKIVGLFKEDNKQKADGLLGLLSGLSGNTVGVVKDVPDDDDA